MTKEQQLQPAPASRELSKDEIYRACDPAQFAFSTTAELPVLREVIGQDRAVGAVDFGIGVPSHGYNIYALGPTGTGKATVIMQHLTAEAASRPAPDDWVYVNNFTTPHKPNAIRLSPGRACAFRADMEKLVEDLQAAITLAFEGEEYDRQRREIAQDVSQNQEAKLDALREKAEGRGLPDAPHPGGTRLRPPHQGRRAHASRDLQLPGRGRAAPDRRGAVQAERRAPTDHAPGAPRREVRPRAPARARPGGDHLRRRAPDRRRAPALGEGGRGVGLLGCRPGGRGGERRRFQAVR